MSAKALDDVGVLGVQFLLDGAPLGAEDTSAPYTINWNASTASTGAHPLSARARDGSGPPDDVGDDQRHGVEATPSITWATPADIVYGTALERDAAERDRQRAGHLRLHPAGRHRAECRARRRRCR